MSNNRSQPSPSTLPFLVVEYNGKKAVIVRDTNYQETLASIKEVFSALRSAQDEAIGIDAHIEEIDDNCRISCKLWAELLPRLTTVQVTLDCPVQQVEPPSETKEPKAQVDPGVTIQIHRRLWGSWNNPVIQIYVTRIPLNRTFLQLLEQIKHQENLTGADFGFRYGACPSNNYMLAERGITSNSVVEFLLQ